MSRAVNIQLRCKRCSLSVYSRLWQATRRAGLRGNKW